MKPLPDISDYAWLTSDAGCAWLAQARAQLQSNDLVGAATRLRRDLSAARTHLVLEQIALRERAKAKFRLTGAMFFTPIALEQATDEIIAGYKARRFPAEGEILDLCCGIGGDAIGLALHCQRVVGVDRNPVHTLLAEANLRCYLDERSLSFDRFAARTGDAQLRQPAPAAWHADPDRRAGGRRTTAVDAHDPPAEVLEGLLKQQPAGAIKLAPAARLPESWLREAECEWISRGGECRQLMAWFGPLARQPGVRAATVLSRDGMPRKITGTAGLPVPQAASVARYIYEPDAAILAAGLNGALASQLGLSGFSADVAYLTSDQPVDDPAIAGFEVLDVLPFQLRGLKAYCRERQFGHIEVKKRGVACDPLSLQKQLSGAGGEPAVVLITLIHGKPTAMVARRLQRRDPSEQLT